MQQDRKFRSSSAALAVMLSITSACAPTAAPPRSVSDFCLNDQPITVNVASAPGQHDPGNHLDSEETVGQVFAHNAVREQLCPAPAEPEKPS